ncbi:hypothetical protein C8Q78DRAFT_1051963 [Trametes maxima]|nr:hypothetical protein C8Q78DRAFT_1051963 [Trametes maxima]
MVRLTTYPPVVLFAVLIKANTTQACVRPWVACVGERSSDTCLARLLATLVCLRAILYVLVMDCCSPYNQCAVYSFFLVLPRGNG